MADEKVINTRSCPIILGIHVAEEREVYKYHIMNGIMGMAFAEPGSVVITNNLKDVIKTCIMVAPMCLDKGKQLIEDKQEDKED